MTNVGSDSDGERPTCDYGEATVLSGWSSISGIARAVPRDIERGGSIILDCSEAVRLTEADARVIAGWQVRAEMLGVRLALCHVHTDDAKLLHSRGARYVYETHDDARHDMLIDELATRMLERVRSLDLPDATLESIAVEIADDAIAPELLAVFLRARTRCRRLIDPIGTASEQDDPMLVGDGEPDDILLNRMLRKFSTKTS